MNRWRRAARLAVVLVILAGLVVGVPLACLAFLGHGRIQVPWVFREEEARSALIALANEKQGFKDTLAALELSPAELLHDGDVCIGPWRCDLKHRSFSIQYGEMGTRYPWWHYHGRFEYTNGAWKAVIIGSEHGH
jgi:hypothetical protein